MSHSDDLKNAHNDGQTDASKEEYHQPYNSIHQLSSFFNPLAPTKELETMLDINKAYNEGQAHTESQKDSGCFLTTACVNYAGLADDCHELTILRSFRDSYVARLAYGSAILAEYYEIAPALVRQIEQSIDRDTVLSDIFVTVTKAVELIEHESYSEAFAHYEAMFNDLKRHHGIPSHSLGARATRPQAFHGG